MFGRPREDADRRLELLQLFAPAIAAAGTPDEARVLIAWRPIADSARKLYPEDCAALDAAFGGTFPFTAERLQAAHARWSADWLAWERTHDTEYKARTALLERESGDRADAASRARVDALEHEKLETYQRRYAEYVQVSKALQAMIAAATMPPPSR